MTVDDQVGCHDEAAAGLVGVTGLDSHDTTLTQQGIEVTDDAVDRQRGLRLSNDLGEDGQSHGGLRQDDEV